MSTLSNLAHAKIPGTNIQATSGWYVAIGCIGAIALSSTQAAPLALGIMTVAFLYQLESLLKGK